MRPPRPRVERFRAPLRPASLALYPRHVVLGALVAGLLAGPRSATVTGVLAGTALAGTVAAHVQGARAARLALLGLAATAAVLLGAVVAGERLRVLDRTELRPHADARVRGVVVEPPRTRAHGVRVAPVRLDGDGERVLVRAQARTGWPEVRVGDEVVARGRLRALEGWEGFERRRHVHAVLEAERIARTGRSRRALLDGVRRRAEDAVAAGLPGEQAALARGMVLGQDHALPEDLRDAFRASGLAHLVAASGTNVMLLAALVLAVGAVAGLPLRARLAVALAAVALYVPIAGAGPSIQRAGVMGAAGLVAALAGRPATRWYALLLAAAATLAVNPRAAEDPGWQLSFAAVVAILVGHRPLCGALADRGLPGPAAEVTALTVAATLGTAPLLALYFEELSLVSLPANVLAAPAVGPVMWLGTAAGVLGGPAADLLNGLAAYPLAYLAWLARAAAAVPGATVPVTLPGPAVAVAAYAALGGAALAVRRLARRAGTARGGLGAARARPGTLVALVVAAVGAAVLVLPGAPGPPAGLVLSVLDVGQGDAVLLQDRAHAVLLDTGPPGAPLVRELRAAGVRRLDAVVITHSSADHEGGLGALLDALPVGIVLDGRGPGREHGGEGGGARFSGVPATIPRGVPAAGQTVRAGRIALDILWPPPGDRRTGDPNATATVALARMGTRSALLTADAESPVTLGLDLPDVDVLKVAHHGSADPGLPALLERVRPEVAVVPVGRNAYGHPAPATLAALRQVPSVRRTDREGTVRVAFE